MNLDQQKSALRLKISKDLLKTQHTVFIHYVKVRKAARGITDWTEGDAIDEYTYFKFTHDAEINLFNYHNETNKNNNKKLSPRVNKINNDVIKNIFKE